MSSEKTTIVFFGSDSFVIPVLQVLEENFTVQAVVTAIDSATAKVAAKLGIPTLTPDKLDETFTAANYSLLTADLFVVASYGKILPQSLLDIPQFGSLNVHPSLLPKYRGASPVPATILAGDKKTGVTIIKMDEKMDHGPIISTKQIILSGQEDFSTLITKLFQEGVKLLVDIIPQFLAGKITSVEQDHSQATFCKLIKKEDGYFDINNPVDQKSLNRMIRAYHPWPGVWTKWEGKIVKFLPENRIQMEGKKPVSIKDFLNGYPDFPLIAAKN
ncbi:MAG: methionyl-tRNA formyltransferase [Candidatus Daviesbacteria bacterium]|nr:MAG: methionyl-tRNA formyltransferase [Candidatus Daviesbacteria bacterium]